MLLQARGTARRIGRGARTTKGAIFFLFGFALFGFWIFSVLVSARYQRPDMENVRSVGPLMLLGICLLTALTSVGDKAVAFTPGEVDFLFPGPFTRRQLLLYKLGKSSLAALLTALLLSFALLRYAGSWAAAFAGVFLILLFVQFLSTTLVLIGQTVSERAYTRGRQIVMIVVIGAAVLGLRGVLARHALTGPERIDLLEVMRQFARSHWGTILLAPFAVFTRALTASGTAELVKCGLEAALVDLLLLAVVVKLDANYLEAAAGATQRRYERLRRMRAGSLMSIGAGKTGRRRLPQPPFLWGAGPVAWRQLTGALRSSRGLLLVLVLLALIAGPIFVAARATPARSPQSSDAPIFTALFSTLAWLSVMLASLLRFDFRADLDAMETVKTLPLRPWAVAAGQLVAPTVVLTAIHLLLIGAVAATFGDAPGSRAPLFIAAALALPFNALLFAAENLIFLVSPSRPSAVGPGDFQILGRQLFSLVARTLVVLLGAGVAAIIAVPVYLLTGRSFVVLTLVATGVLFVEVGALVPAIGYAYQRFDPSMHTPA